MIDHAFEILVVWSIAVSEEGDVNEKVRVAPNSEIRRTMGNSAFKWKSRKTV